METHRALDFKINLERGRPEYKAWKHRPTWFGADWLLNWDSGRRWVVGEPLTLQEGEHLVDFFTNDRHHPGDSVIFNQRCARFTTASEP